mmetsp:Transcript_46920/g.69778  ORF Transcript_46920/g.69778 Transcript_46920/m.69778 type:complete len:303 (-) Transcript_46920:135-1043(-)|eukprot:CAMPEP_0194047172 /NCGR_PEP_ID=MMETSP0009_2-20130614/23602_1 /TAXON_ID=210454 /ORGANISM="Grammatophora oceanica, Strain CCMP 410" /LENGTH=302 /DNA_ID=CAMNT_0038692705 /DNA_START=35 /DNA_END=943 /DNA_ORIENTATION=+
MGYPSKDAAELTKKLLDLEDQSEYDDHEAGDVKKTKSTMRVADAAAHHKAAPPPRSCCSCCCKCLLITLLVLFLLGVAMVATLYHMTSKVVHDFTITEPHAKYPVVDMSEAEARLVGDRLNLFVDELLADKVPSEELVLTQDEINGVIGRDDYLRGNAMITLEKGIIREEVSLPVSMLPGGEGRYFVAHDYTKIDDEEDGGHFEVKLETEAKHEDWFDGPLYFARLQMLFSPPEEQNNMLELYLEKGSFFGNEVDQDFIDEHHNLMDYLYQDPSKKDLIKIMEGIEKISVLPGKLVITPRSA